MLCMDPCEIGKNTREGMAAFYSISKKTGHNNYDGNTREKSARQAKHGAAVSATKLNNGGICYEQNCDQRDEDVYKRQGKF